VDEAVTHHVYSPGDIVQENVEGRRGFDVFYLIEGPNELMHCSTCDCVAKMSGRMHKLTMYENSAGHQFRLRGVDATANADLARRMHDALGMACFRAQPFAIVEDPRSFDPVQGDTRAECRDDEASLVATGIVTERMLQMLFHESMA
jgi:hypothetical protein